MNNKKLLTKLNWFYTLEVNQVDLYLRQSASTEDVHMSMALQKFAKIEQGHVESIRQSIEMLGETPTLLGEVLGEITGTIAGTLTSITSLEQIFRFDIAIETKAIADYMKLIEETNDSKIRDILYSNMIDEELHTSWMKDALTNKLKN